MPKAQRSPGSKIMLALVWLALCTGLYLIGNLPKGAATTLTNSVQTIDSRQPGTRVPTASTNANPPRHPVPTLQAQPASRAGGEMPILKPVRDQSNLEVFATGLERTPDYGAEEPPDGNEAP